MLEPQEQLSLERHPDKPRWLRLHVPYTRVASYLSLVKNIHGRRWNPDAKVWEVPYTKLTLRFVEQYLRDVTQIAFTPHRNIPETLVLGHSEGLRYVPPKEVTPARYEQAAQRRLFVHAGKGKKDRYTLLSDRALEALPAYYKLYRPVEWVFEGQHGGKSAAFRTYSCAQS